MNIKILDIKKVQQVHDILQDLSIKTPKTGYSDVFEIPKNRVDEFIDALNRSKIRHEKQSKLKEMLRPIVHQILKEAKTSVNLEQPHSNLYIKGWGFDKNGNQRIIVGLPNDKGVSIQTNGNLPETHSIIRGVKKLTPDELSIIGQEITDYVSQYGPASLKSKLKIYKK